MSFLLDFFHAQDIFTIDEAVAFINNPPKATKADFARFRQFISDITAIYPDYSGQGSDSQENIWPEGLNNEFSDDDDTVYVVALRTDLIDANLMSHIGNAAARAQLHILDQQNGLLYRIDRMVVDMNGDETPLQTPLDIQPRLYDIPFVQITKKDILNYAKDSFCQRFASHGFKFSASSPIRFFIARTIGEVKQTVVFFAHKEHKDPGPERYLGGAILRATLSLGCPAVSQIWKNALGNTIVPYLAREEKRGAADRDFSLNTDELFSMPSVLARRFGHYWTAPAWRSLAEIDRWLDLFNTFFADEILPLLDTVARVKDVAPLVLSNQQLDRLQQNNDFLPWELLSRLVMAGTFDRTQKNDWIKALWDRYHRENGYKKNWENTELSSLNIDSAFERFIIYMTSDQFLVDVKHLAHAN